jgi:hypothetical protein
MNFHMQSPQKSDLSLEVIRSLLSEATRRPWLAAGFSAVAILAAAFLWTSPAHAGTITVDGTTCSLANAITTANSGSNTSGCTGGSAGADTIDLQTDVTLTATLPQITTEITVEGNGYTIHRSSATAFSILTVASGGNLTLKQATITGGSANNGGGINNSGALTVQDSTITGNSSSTSSGGGGIYSDYATLSVQNSIITNNTATNGGGIFIRGGNATIQNSTISGNTATTSDGGGIVNIYGYLTVVNSTITGNSASNGAGMSSSLVMTGSTTVKNSIIANQSSGVDCYTYGGSITSQGYNIESDTSCGFTGTGDQHNVSSGSLNLGTLADNGGPTQTHALGSGSVAIDQIPNGVNGCVSGTSVDQRGAVRADGANRGGSGCDVGAYEANSNQNPTAVMLRSLVASTRSPIRMIAAFVAAVTASGAGWLGWRRRQT